MNPRPRLLAALMRHGDYHQLPHTPSAHQPFALNANGRQQAVAGADKLAAGLAGLGGVLEPVIDSSRLLRAWQTARLIADSLPSGAAIAEFDALAERGVGTAANLSIEQIEQVLDSDPRYPSPPTGWKADSHYQLPFPGAESLLQAGERVAGHIRTRMSQLDSIDTAAAVRVKLFVGHGAAFRHAAYHLGVLKFHQIAMLSMYHAEPLFLECLADGRWRQVAGHWKQRHNEAFAD